MKQGILRIVPLFADLDDDDLDHLCEMVDEVRLADRQVLFREGDRGDKAYVIKSGELEIIKLSGGREVLLAVRKRGEVIGEMSLLEDAPRMASVRARGDTTLLSIKQEVISDLVGRSASAARAMFHTVLARSRATGAMLRQSEKMAQLGTLTAGVAHELNNPAAAVQRSAAQLEDVLADYGAACAGVEPLKADPRWPTLVDLEVQARAAAKQPDLLDPLERSDLEANIEDWLDDNALDDALDLAPALVAIGLEPDRLDDLRDQLDDALGAALSWLASSYTVFGLLAEVGEGATRISTIVKSLKSYAYLDQAPVQDVDVHAGLNDTLVLLRSKLKQVTVNTEFDPNLPTIQAHGSELNQVWTNLLDNAAYAAGNGGKITIRTRHEAGFVIVEIEDNGPGMPPEVQQRVFDAFFTTKPPGVGTGLGLDISYRIVANKHGGNMKVSSRPGRTVFEVWLPTQEDIAVAAINQISDEALGEILDSTKSIAVVGLSDDPKRPAHSVPRYLQKVGYKIIPVNPKHPELLGETSVGSLSEIDEPVDVVLAFRRPEHMPELVAQAIALGAKTFWMPEGVVNDDAASTARDAGLAVVMDLCMRVTHRRLRPSDEA